MTKLMSTSNEILAFTGLIQPIKVQLCIPLLDTNLTVMSPNHRSFYLTNQLTMTSYDLEYWPVGSWDVEYHRYIPNRVPTRTQSNVIKFGGVCDLNFLEASLKCRHHNNACACVPARNLYTLPFTGSVSWNASGCSGLSPRTTIHPTTDVILLGLDLNEFLSVPRSDLAGKYSKLVSHSPTQYLDQEDTVGFLPSLSIVFLLKHPSQTNV